MINNVKLCINNQCVVVQMISVMLICTETLILRRTNSNKFYLLFIVPQKICQRAKEE